MRALIVESELSEAYIHTSKTQLPSAEIKQLEAIH